MVLGLVASLAGGLVVGFAGLVVGLVGGVVFGVTFGLSGRQLPERLSLSPNEGIWRSGKNGLIGGLAGGLIFGLIAGLMVELTRGLGAGIVLGLFTGLGIGLFAGIGVGLGAFVKHFLLRFFLSLRRDLPWTLVPFLNEAVMRLLLRRVGGSYIFVHRLLLDYFAELGRKVI